MIGKYEDYEVNGLAQDELDEQLALLVREHNRRETMQNTGRILDDLLVDYRKKTNQPLLGHGEEWFEPADIYDAYPLGARVVDDEGNAFLSLTHANMHGLDEVTFWQPVVADPDMGEAT